MGSDAFGVFTGGLRLVASSRGRESMDRLVAFVSVCGFGSGLVGCLVTKLGILIGELGCLLEVCDELGLPGRDLSSEGAVCCRESHNVGVITGRSCDKVGDSLNRVLIADGGISGLETGAVSGDLRLPPFLVGSCEEYF